MVFITSLREDFLRVLSSNLVIPALFTPCCHSCSILISNNNNKKTCKAIKAEITVSLSKLGMKKVRSYRKKVLVIDDNTI